MWFWQPTSPFIRPLQLEGQEIRGCQLVGPSLKACGLKGQWNQFWSETESPTAVSTEVWGQEKGGLGPGEAASARPSSAFLSCWPAQQAGWWPLAVRRAACLTQRSNLNARLFQKHPQDTPRDELPTLWPSFGPVSLTRGWPSQTNLSFKSFLAWMNH